jgi:5-methyltetrahydropteroyltriglutamate--homocysteine methyltransferase
VVIPFEDGHTRQLPVLTAGPFRYSTHSGRYVAQARKHTDLPLKQAVIAPSALSLLYPQDGIEGYARETFIEDLTNECVRDIRSAFDAGAEVVQLDFTEGRLACKLDPSRGLLRQFVDLNNGVLERFSEAKRAKIGIHTCPGGDHNSTHSADIDYAELLPDLFRMQAGRFYIQMASEADRPRVLDIIQRERQAGQTTFIGVIDPCNTNVETAETVCERVLEVAEHLKDERYGTTDDCGFSPFGDDTAMARTTAFAKIKARVEGTAIAADKLGHG